MQSIPSPILIFGDPYVSKNNIVTLKKKYPHIKWVTKSASTDSLDDIRMEAGLSFWDDSEKGILIHDLPNKKAVRDFLVDLCKGGSQTTKIVIWDSNCNIKTDPKSQCIEKTWNGFVEDIKNINGSKVINNGDVLTEKSSEDSITFVVNCFARGKKNISVANAKLLISIVGYDRGMLESDIKKMLLTCPDELDAMYIINNAFPSTKEALIYKLSNIIDEGDYDNTIELMDKFLSSGINPNVIAETFLRKARWQMVAIHLWTSGLSWDRMPDKLMEMGKFPSSIWHDSDIDASQKKSMSEPYQTPEKRAEYLATSGGIPWRYFTVNEEAKSKRAEVVPMYFMAGQIVDYVKYKIIGRNNSTEEFKKKVMDKSIWVYSFIQDKLAEVRYGESPIQCLNEMAKVLTNVSVEST